MIKDGRIAVTGGAGFIGSHLVERLLEHGAREVVVLDDFSSGDRSNLDAVAGDERLRIVEADVRNRSTLAPIGECDCLVHLAATKHNPSKSDPDVLIETNINGTYAALRTAVEGRVRRVVFASSLYVYGTDRPGPFAEADALGARSLYGATKIAGERLVRSMTSAASIQGLSLRYFFVYGPRLYQKNYADSLVPRSLRRVLQGTPPEVYGNGEQVFDYIYIDDAVTLTMRALEYAGSHDVLNICSGRGVTVLEVARELIRQTDHAGDVVFGPADETAGTVRVGNAERMIAELGSVPLTDLREGLRRSAAWWRGRQPG